MTDTQADDALLRCIKHKNKEIESLKKTIEEKEKEIAEFAEWCNDSGWKFDSTSKTWSPAFIRVYDPKTTSELIKLWRESK